MKLPPSVRWSGRVWVSVFRDQHGRSRPSRLIGMAELEALLDASAGREAAERSMAVGRDARVRAMVDAHFDVVWRSLRRLGVPDGGVDDAAQQVFLVASRKVDEIGLGGERAYLLGVAVRVAADARRAHRRRREVFKADEDEPDEEGRLDPGASPTTEDLVDQKRARELLDEVLAEMPEDLREVFVLFEVEGIGVAQIASLLGVPLGTVGSRIRRARELFEKKVNRRVRSSPMGGVA
jgi:RNA polymerase sigma-70 factor (ECF subfamily)